MHTHTHAGLLERFDEMDTDFDDVLSNDEFLQYFNSTSAFSALDRNHDNVLTREEIEDAMRDYMARHSLTRPSPTTYAEPDSEEMASLTTDGESDNSFSPSERYTYREQFE